jgi:saccharopine dehydrogenase-like NADP-dependent oxidoreductase
VSEDRYTVAVLGAGGTIAPAVVRDLAESEEVEGLRLLDVNGERAAAVAATHGRGRASAAAVDARHGLAQAIDGCNALVNCASYRVNIDAMRACLQSRCHYLDLGGLYWLTGKQLELNDDFERADLLAVLGIGSSPGKTNVMARRAAHELDRVDRIDVSAAGRDLDPPDGFSVPYALRTLLDEVTMRPVVLRDGRPLDVDPLTPGGSVDFGPEIGEAETIYTLHSELRTFGDSFTPREASFRLSLAKPLLEKLRELAGAPESEQEEAAAGTVPPSPNTISAHVIEAYGDGRRVRVSALTRPNAGWNLGGGIVSTAAPAAATVRLLQRGRIEARGALPPERCIDPDDLFPELERRGTEFRIEHENNSDFRLAAKIGSSEGAGAT